MKKPLALIVPTRNRPKNAERLYVQTFTTMQVMDSEDVYFVVGNEDPQLEKYIDWLADRVKVFPSRGLVKALNWMAPQLVDKYDNLAFMGDDHFPQTQHWDAKYCNELYQLGDGFVYGDDLLMGERMPTQIAMTSSIVKSLGFFAPPGFTHLCIDLAWKDLGESIGKITYMSEVIIEHLHSANEKAPWDEGYAYANSPEMVQRDEAEYVRWKRDDLPNEVAYLKRVLRSLQ